MPELPMSREEAEQLANEFLKRRTGRFYDEHYREDNPALLRFVKDSGEFIAMLHRRGYSRVVSEYNAGVWTFQVTIDERPTTFLEAFFLHETVAEVARRLDEMAGQHHVQCAQCRYPLLREMKNKDTYATLNYRSAIHGPQSKPLQVCPQCQQYIQDLSVQEIRDDVEPQLPNGYSIVKDAALNVWYVLVDGALLNLTADLPWSFTSERQVVTFCYWHDKIKHLVIDALENDSPKHKQWYLWRLADTLDLDATEIYAEEGIAP